MCSYAHSNIEIHHLNFSSRNIVIFKVIGQGHQVKFLGEGICHALRCPCHSLFLFCSTNVTHTRTHAHTQLLKTPLHMYNIKAFIFCVINNCEEDILISFLVKTVSTKHLW